MLRREDVRVIIFLQKYQQYLFEVRLISTFKRILQVYILKKSQILYALLLIINIFKKGSNMFKFTIIPSPNLLPC